MYDRCIVEPKSVLGRRADRTDYGYDHDSDLEDEEDDMNPCVNATEAVLTKPTVPAAPPTPTAQASYTHLTTSLSLYEDSASHSVVPAS